MSGTDIRLRTGFFVHPKTLKLKRRLGLEGVVSLLTLWTHAGEYKQSGILEGMDAEDIAIAGGWSGDPNLFIDTLLEVGFVDTWSNTDSNTDSNTPRITLRKLHDWDEHQPWIVDAPARSRQAKKAIEKRWSNHRASQGEDTDRNTDRTTDSPDQKYPSPILSSPILSSPKNNTDSVSKKPDIKRPVKKKPKADPNHKIIVEYFCEQYQERFEQKYLFKGGKDGEHLKQLLATYGVDQLKAMIDTLFTTSDPWIAGTERGINILFEKANKLSQDASSFLDFKKRQNRQAQADAEAANLPPEPELTAEQQEYSDWCRRYAVWPVIARKTIPVGPLASAEQFLGYCLGPVSAKHGTCPAHVIKHIQEDIKRLEAVDGTCQDTK